MFNHIRGIVTDLAPNYAVIECGGVGFGVTVSAYTLSQLQIGTETKLLISEQIREDAFDLFGFGTMAEKDCFDMLISVSGVGPKAAVSILSTNTPEGISAAIVSGNDKVLTAAPGIGKKLAQRVILELQDRIRKQSGGLAGMGTGAMPAGGESFGRSNLSDAEAALTALGYSASESAAALRGIDTSLPLEDMIRAALRNMMK